MKNPWEEIPLDDYENHMKLDSVMQLQAMNEMMKGQFDTYPISSVMVLGVAGGNGLEHIQKNHFEKVYGVDINASYLQEVVLRYPDFTVVLEESMIGYHIIKTLERLLPNGKKLVQMDFETNIHI